MTVKEFLDMSCFKFHILVLLVEHKYTIDNEYILIESHYDVPEEYINCTIIGFHDEEYYENPYDEIPEPGLILHIKKEVRK